MMTDAGGAGRGAIRRGLAERRSLPSGYRAVAAAGLLLYIFAGCAVSPRPSDLSAETPGPGPLPEPDIGLVTALIDLADRRDFDFPLFSRGASAAHPKVRRQTAYAAGRTRSVEARPIARHLLADADSAVSAAAAFALGELGDSASVSLLSERLLTRDSTFAPPVAIAAAEALGKIGTDEARATLRGFLAGADSAEAAASPGVVSEALIAGWRAGLGESEPLARWLTAPSPEVRWSAVYGLTRTPHPEAVPLLIPLLADPDWRVRSLALRGVRHSLVEEAGAAVPEALSRIRPLLDDSSYAVRIEAIRTLATFGPGPGLEAVVAAALGGGPHERAAAIEALGRAGADAMEASGPLLGIALDPRSHPFHRELAAEAMARIDPPAAAANLPILLGEPSWRLRAAAGRALGSLPELDYASIAAAATDSDPRVATATVRALAEREDTASLRSVRSILVDALLGSDIQLRAATLDAGAHIADPTLFSLFLDAFAQAQGDSIPDARLAAIDAIATLKDRGVPFPERVFFARFPESSEYLVRQRVEERFGGEVRNSWGPAFPLESGEPLADIEAVVRRWIAPADSEADRPHILVQTDRGDLTLELFPEEAPLTVANFLDLVRSGFFDGQEWPRVVPNFVVQGGDPRGDTAGGIGHVIRDEMNRHRYGVGTLGMALAGPDTGGSQFFVTHSPQPHLDGTYTVFGRLLSGVHVIEQLMVGDRILRIAETPAQTAQ